MSSGAGISGTGYGSISPQVQRSKSFTRKDTARKCLLGSLNTRFSDVRHSSPMTSREPMRHDIRFPKVNKCARSYSMRQTKSEKVSIRSQSSSHAHSHSADISDDSRSQEVHIRNGKIISGGKSTNNGLNLPEIIMELNIETNMAATQDPYEATRSNMSETSEGERAIGAPYEEFLKRPNHCYSNPCRAHYRPVTPGLLDSLNKKRMPSKIRTEQWLKSTQYLTKSQCGHVYKTDRLNNTFPNWIYTDT